MVVLPALRGRLQPAALATCGHSARRSHAALPATQPPTPRQMCGDGGADSAAAADALVAAGYSSVQVRRAVPLLRGPLLLLGPFRQWAEADCITLYNC